MNILLLNWRDPNSPNSGGAERVTLEYAKSWSKAGHQVIWFTARYHGAKKKEVIDGIEFVRYGNEVIGVHLAACLWYLFGRHQKFDIVIDQIHGIPFFTPLYVRTKRLAFIHEVAKDVWKLNPWPKPLYYLPAILGTSFESSLYKVLYRNMPFLTVSESTRNELVEWGIPKKNITVIHNGIDIPRLSQPVQKEKQKTIIFLGTLAKDKGIFDAIEAFSYVQRKYKSMQFWIVGKGSRTMEKEVRSQVTKKGLEKNATFWGYVSEAEKFSLLRRSHILIHPSVREGWGLVIIEAASQGTPAVAYDVAGLRDSIQNGKTGVLVNDKTPRALAQTITQLLTDEDRYSLLQKNCFAWAKSLTWDTSTYQSLSLLKSL